MSGCKMDGDEILRVLCNMLNWKYSPGKMKKEFVQLLINMVNWRCCTIETWLRIEMAWQQEIIGNFEYEYSMETRWERNTHLRIRISDKYGLKTGIVAWKRFRNRRRGLGENMSGLLRVNLKRSNSRAGGVKSKSENKEHSMPIKKNENSKMVGGMKKFR